MGLAETQKALARIYTDTNLRERFFADPQAVGEELGLASEEAQKLAGLSTQKAAYFAASLVNKRMDEVAKLLPHSSRLLGQQFRKLFREYAQTHLPRGAKKHLDDALAFASFAEGHARLADCAPPWFVELLIYEREFLRAGEPKRYLRWRRFRYPVDEIARRLAQGKPVSAQLEARPTVIFWFRPTRQGKLRQRVVRKNRPEGDE